MINHDNDKITDDKIRDHKYAFCDSTSSRNVVKVKLWLNSLFYRKVITVQMCFLRAHYVQINDIWDHSGLSNSRKSHYQVGSGSAWTFVWEWDMDGDPANH
jgi:hypothetical protein